MQNAKEGQASCSPNFFSPIDLTSTEAEIIDYLEWLIMCTQMVPVTEKRNVTNCNF
jgi:hypothetical protein